MSHPTVFTRFDRGKVTKEESGYLLPTITASPKGLRCDNCFFFDAKTRSCTPVWGDIDPAAICNLWVSDKVQKPIIRLNYLSGKQIDKKLKKGRVSKKDAGYICESEVPAEIRSRNKSRGVNCHSCGYTNKEAKSCGVIDPKYGPIDPYGCCNRYYERGGKNDSATYLSGREVIERTGAYPISDIEDLMCA